MAAISTRLRTPWSRLLSLRPPPRLHSIKPLPSSSSTIPLFPTHLLPSALRSVRCFSANPIMGDRVVQDLLAEVEREKQLAREERRKVGLPLEEEEEKDDMLIEKMNAIEKKLEKLADLDHTFGKKGRVLEEEIRELVEERNSLTEKKRRPLYRKVFSNITYSSLHPNAQLCARSLHVKAHGGEMKAQPGNLHLQQNNISRVLGVDEPNCLKQRENGSSKVIAFSPLEGTLTRERKSELVHESSKVKRMELSIKTTYALIPLLLLVSKTKLTTSMLVMCIYWQVYWFFKEIFLDYVHHEVTRKWVLIYFKLLLFILAKDTILAFDLE